MSIVFNPSGSLNVAHDPSDLPESVDQNSSVSGAMVRCKNLRLNEAGKAKTRDGSAKLNAVAIATPIWWIEEQGGDRYSFAGTQIYEDETSIASGLTSAQWAAIQYNAFNDTQLNVFALNGTDRKRIEGGAVYEWGLDAPTVAPELASGHGSGLTGEYNARYTYVRKIGDVVVAESNPSPMGTSQVLADESLAVGVTQPTDLQVTHIRLYRTLANGELGFFDQDIAVGFEYGYGYTFDWELSTEAGVTVSGGSDAAFEYGVCFEWESEDEYLTGGGYKWTTEDDTNLTENAYAWEERYTEDIAWDASVSSATIAGSGSASTVTTGVVTVTVEDPNGTPTYAWSKVSGDAISVISPSSASTAFRAHGMDVEEIRSATFQCVVTDMPNSEILSVQATCFRFSTL